MKMALKLLAIFTIFIATETAFAEIPTDKAAHFGMSFAMQTFLYGSMKKVLRLDRDPDTGMLIQVSTKNRLIANLFAATAVGMVGMLKEYSDMSGSGPSATFDGGDMLANGIGIVSATAFTFVFEF